MIEIGRDIMETGLYRDRVYLSNKLFINVDNIMQEYLDHSIEIEGMKSTIRAMFRNEWTFSLRAKINFFKLIIKKPSTGLVAGTENLPYFGQAKDYKFNPAGKLLPWAEGQIRANFRKLFTRPVIEMLYLCHDKSLEKQHIRIVREKILARATIPDKTILLSMFTRDDISLLYDHIIRLQQDDVNKILNKQKTKNRHNINRYNLDEILRNS
jgi:hypothetical protein